MTAKQAPHGIVIGFAGSIVAHVCLAVMLVAGISQSAPRWDRALTLATGTDPQRGFDADVSGDDRGLTSGKAAVIGNVASDADVVASPLRRVVSETFIKKAVERTRSSAPRILWHLWQSTIVAALVALLVWRLRRQGAHVRYWLWFAASMKFFVPLSIFTIAGGYAGSLLAATPATQQMRRTGVEVLTRLPLVMTSMDAARSSTGLSETEWVQFVALAVWILGALSIGTMRFRMWRRVKATLRTSTRVELRNAAVSAEVQLLSAPGVLEPGVVGWRRPVLLLPEHIDAHLTPTELDAVIAHEICHIRRRDNLTAALHMLTEIVFWFHPAVWWIGARLLVERERACDEAVVADGRDPGTYARAIVNTCAMCTACPVAFVAGVTGSDLRRRIETILKNDRRVPMNAWTNAAVSVVAALVIVVPVGSGILRAAPRVTAQVAIESSPAAFEAASVKVNKSGLEQAFDSIQPGGRYTATNMALVVLIRLAYERSPRSRGLEPFEVAGGPKWIATDRFDVNATAGRDVSLTEMRSMLRTLLADRFRVKAHYEKRQGSIYRMVLAQAGRLGPQLRRTAADCAREPFDPLRGVTPGVSNVCGYFGPSPTISLDSDRAYQAMRGMTMADFATSLYPYLGRRVIDETRLTGYFDADFEFTSEIVMPPPPSGPNPFDGRVLPSIFSVLPHQLGLKLESARGPVDILVIDQAAHPTEN
ncbi:MAG TPA: M56 family metallopeptidase [Vicinamibacterales bacterium]|jgi:uncharacterized protein (TIGR03435 family)